MSTDSPVSPSTAFTEGDSHAESPHEMSRRAILKSAFAASAAFALAGQLRYVALAQDTPQAGGKLVMGLQSEPSDNIDPHVTPWAVSHNVMMNVYDTLVWQDPADGSFKPGLATAWEVAPDGLSYTFTLRTDVKFHDGSAFNAGVVKWNFDRIADPATKSGFAANLLGPYAASEVIDDATIKVTFKEPYAPFLDSASQAFLGMVSPDAVAKHGADYGVVAAVGTGPFMFKEWVRADHLTMVKNPDYNWAGGVFMHTGPAYLDEIEFKFIAEDATRTGTLQSDETNLIELTPETDIQLLTDEGYTILPGRAPGLPSTIFLNTSVAPTNDLAVRKAMLMATDKQTIIDTIYFGVYEPAMGPQAKSSWVYDPAVEATHSFDLEAAKAMLDEAGWVLNGDIREKDGAKLEIQFLATQFDKWAELWQAQMRDLGADVKITQIDLATWIATAGEGKHNVTALGWISSDPIILENLFHSKNVAQGTGFGWSFWKDAALDEALDKGRAAIDQAERKALYGQAQVTIMENALVIPLYDQVGFNSMNANVKDVRVDARGWYRWLYDAWIAS